METREVLVPCHLREGRKVIRVKITDDQFESLRDGDITLWMIFEKRTKMVLGLEEDEANIFFYSSIWVPKRSPENLFPEELPLVDLSDVTWEISDNSI